MMNWFSFMSSSMARKVTMTSDWVVANLNRESKGSASPGLK